MKRFLGIFLAVGLLLSGCGELGNSSIGSGEKSGVSSSAAGSSSEVSQGQQTGTNTEPEQKADEAEFVIRLSGEYDFDHDGRVDILELVSPEICSQEYELRVRSAAGVELHSIEGLSTSHLGCGNVFVCQMDEGDYLLRYYHNISNGWGLYDFEIFSLSGTGEKQMLDEGHVSFDMMCGSPQFSGEYDVNMIAAFLNRVHSYLDHGTMLFSAQNGAVDLGFSGAAYTLDDFTKQTEGDWAAKLRKYQEETENWWRKEIGIKKRLPLKYDFDHDGENDVVEVVTRGETGDSSFELRVSRADGTLLWRKEGHVAHAGWVDVFAYEEDGKDYILDYCPGMWQGSAGYSYRLFSLDETGEEVLLREDSVKFDLNFGMFAPYHEPFDADAVGAFLEEIHGYLEKSVCLLSTSGSNVTTGDSGADYRDPVFDGVYKLYDEEGIWAEKLRRLEQRETS